MAVAPPSGGGHYAGDGVAGLTDHVWTLQPVLCPGTTGAHGPRQSKAISQKNIPYSGGWCWVDQNVVLGQCRMALPIYFQPPALPPSPSTNAHLVERLSSTIGCSPFQVIRLATQHGHRHRSASSHSTSAPRYPSTARLDYNCCNLTDNTGDGSTCVNVVSELKHAMQGNCVPLTALRGPLSI